MNTNLSRKGFLQLLVGSALALSLPAPQKASSKASETPEEVVEALEAMPLPDPTLHAQSYYGSYTKFPTGVYTEYGVIGVLGGSHKPLMDRARSMYHERLRLKVADALYKHYLDHPEEWVCGTGKIRDICPFEISGIETRSVHHPNHFAYHETYQITVARKMSTYHRRFVSPGHVGELFLSGRPWGVGADQIVMQMAVDSLDLSAPGSRSVLLGIADFTSRNYGVRSNVGHLLQLTKCDSHTLPASAQILDSELSREWQEFEATQGTWSPINRYMNPGYLVNREILFASDPENWDREYYDWHHPHGIPSQCYCDDGSPNGHRWGQSIFQLCHQLVHSSTRRYVGGVPLQAKDWEELYSVIPSTSVMKYSERTGRFEDHPTGTLITMGINEIKGL